MRKFIFFILAIISVSVSAKGPDSLSRAPFGKVYVYRPDAPPTSVVLFISGDGGWNKGVVGMAQHLTGMGALVVGIDIRTYYRNLAKQDEKCLYPASDFENLSLYIQKKYGLQQYKKPVLAGYSSGATLVYGLIVQAPANTFKGGVSLGFCPDIEISKPLCPGAGLTYHVLKPGISYYLEAAKSLSAPWIALHGTVDQVCDQKQTEEFMSKINNAKIVVLPKVGHGFGVERNWLPQFKDAFTEIFTSASSFDRNRQTAPASQDMKLLYSRIESLPVTVCPAPQKEKEKMILMISGDGGWTSWDQSLAEELSILGYSVAGLDAQKYFWDKRYPETVTDDLQHILDYYRQLWKSDSIILAGYSFGANIIPFVINRLDPPYIERLERAVMLSPDPKADFEIHVADMIDIPDGRDTYDVVAELKKSGKVPVICIFGESEDPSDQAPFHLPHVKIRTIPGSHHYKDDFPLISETLLK